MYLLRIAALTLLFIDIAAVVTTPGSISGISAWLSRCQMIAAIAVMAAGVYAIVHNRKTDFRRLRGVWVLTIVAAGAVLGANFLVEYSLYMFAVLPTYPTEIDVLLALAGLLIGIALLKAANRIAPQPIANRKPLRRYPAALIGLSVPVILWGPVLFTSVPLDEKAMAAALMLIDMLLVFSIWRIVSALSVLSPSENGTVWRQPWPWLAGGAALLLLSDLSFAITSFFTIFNPIIELVWVLALSSLAWAALRSVAHDPLFPGKG